VTACAVCSGRETAVINVDWLPRRFTVAGNTVGRGLDVRAGFSGSAYSVATSAIGCCREGAVIDLGTGPAASVVAGLTSAGGHRMHRGFSVAGSALVVN
jgi:hypothetical protein